MNLTRTKREQSAKRTPRPGKKRYRRSDKEIIADLEAEIDRLKKRKAVRGAKRTEEIKHTIAALRSIDKALETAGDNAHRKVLEEAKVALAAFLNLEGVPIPKKRGRKKKQKPGGDEGPEAEAA